MNFHIPIFSTCMLFTMIFSPWSYSQVIQSEPNDSIGTATPSTLVAGSSGAIISNGNNGDGPFGPTTGDSSGDVDFFEISANAGQVIIFDINSAINLTGVDTVAGIYDSTGTLLVSNDNDGVTRDSIIRYLVPTTGTYYGVVSSWVPTSTNTEGSLPTDPLTPGTGPGVPGGAIGDYELIILLDGERYLTHTPPPLFTPSLNEAATNQITLTNEGSELLTITELNIIGAGASTFSHSHTLPITIPSGSSEDISVDFLSSASTDIFQAELEVVSDDIARPRLNILLIGRAIAGPLLHIPFDDPVGTTTPAQIAELPFPIFLAVNDVNLPPVFESPSITGTGTSIFLNDGGSSANWIGTDNGFIHTPSFTYSLWVRPVAGSATDTLFNRDGQFSLGDNIYGCSIETNGVVNFNIGSTILVGSPVGAVPDGEIRHIVITHQDSTGFDDFIADRTRLYIDGVLIDENTTPPGIRDYLPTSTNTRLWIATRSAAGTGFNGNMAQFQLYGRELSTNEVQQLFENPTSVITITPPRPS